MKILYILSIVLVLALISCKEAPKAEIADLVKKEDCKKDKDGMFIHVSNGYNNPQKVLTALNLAVKMAETQDVALFFDIEGVKLLTKTSEDIQMENFISLHDALNKLIEQKVLIMACPMYLKKEGIEPDQLKEGIIIAEKEKIFDFTKGRILSLDY